MSSSVAHNFAKSLVQLAKEKNILKQVENCAEYLCEGMKVSEVQFFLGNPKISNRIKKEFIHKLNIPDPPQEFINLLDLMVDRGYGYKLPETLEKIIDLSIEAQGYEIVTLISAQPLSETEQSACQRRLENLWSTRIFLKLRVNPGLLGGAVVLRDGKLYDGSLVGQLDNLRQKLLREFD